MEERSGSARRDADHSPYEVQTRPQTWRIGLLRTVAFRIVLLYVALFAISTTAILAFTYWNTKRALNSETDSIVSAELSALEGQYQELGLVGLINALNVRSMRGGQMLYVLTDPRLRRIAGNLDGWPKVRARESDYQNFKYDRDGQTRHARGFVFNLTGGLHLLVARDIHEQYESERLFTTALPWSVGLLLLLALGGGVLLSSDLLRRLDVINSTSKVIMAGDLTRRVPVSRAHDEFDLVASNLNSMLDRIEQLMKGMREVTDSVAHDLRSPLNRLRNRLESAATRLDPDTHTAAQIDAAIAETDHLIATFNALLLIAQAEAGVVREAMTLVDLTSVVEGVAELYAPVAEEKGIELAVDLGEPLTLEANRTLISQALANLVDNAIKYTPEGGKIDVRLEERSGVVVLSVADNGPGIPASEHKRVTERFVRLEQSRNSPGTGLGLSLVAAVARLHEARFVLADNGPGLKASLEFVRHPRR